MDSRRSRTPPANIDRIALSMIEAAASVGASRAFLELERARGRLKVRQVGRRLFVLRSDLEAWLRGETPDK